MRNLLLFFVLANCMASAAARLWVVYQFHRHGIANGDRRKLVATLERYGEVQKALPPYTVIGYLTDRPYKTYSTSLDENPISVSELQDIQLAVAPLLLARNHAQVYLLGDFSNPAEAHKQIKEKKLTVERDFGAGVFLLRRCP